MMSESIQQHEGERGNTVDQVAELLMADEPTCRRGHQEGGG